MRSYLIVANQTLTSESLREAISARLADEPVRTYVVVPMSPGTGRLSWDEGEARTVAKGSTTCWSACARWARKPTVRSAIAIP
jgi:hypothetical protein